MVITGRKWPKNEIVVKFDGLGPRTLRPAEVGQIAGRAGRHVRDGTFGPTLELEAFDERLVEAVEAHRFEPLETVFWRNSDLAFRSPEALLASLEERPPEPWLVRMRQADDHRALETLRRDEEVRKLASGPDDVRLLWDVCQVPDFRNVMSEAHARLLGQIFRHLRGPARRLPEDWVSAQVSGLDRLDGDIDALLLRIAHIRTWTYVSHRSSWLSDAGFWQGRTRAVEDRLSDALHERLTRQFVDRGGAVVARTEPGEMTVEVASDGEVRLQGLPVGRLEGFRFAADPTLREDARLRAAANRALREHVDERMRAFAEERDAALSLDAEGRVLWREVAVARLAKGEEPLRPRVEPLPSELLDPTRREKVRRRVADWTEARLTAAFAPLLRAEAEAPAGAVRGLVFALRSGLGTALRRDVAAQLAHLGPDEQRALARFGVSLGRLAVFLPALLGPDAVHLRAILWAVHHHAGPVPSFRAAASVARDLRLPGAFYLACGYVPAGPRAVRADRLERFAAAARRAARHGRPPAAGLGELIGATPPEVAGVLAALGLARDGAAAGRHRAAAGSRRRG